MYSCASELFQSFAHPRDRVRALFWNVFGDFGWSVISCVSFFENFLLESIVERLPQTRLVLFAASSSMPLLVVTCPYEGIYFEISYHASATTREIGSWHHAHNSTNNNGVTFLALIWATTFQQNRSFSQQIVQARRSEFDFCPPEPFVSRLCSFQH